MNRSYRLIWSQRHNALVVASEATKGRGKSGCKSKAIVSAVAGALLVLGGQAMATCTVTEVTGTLNAPCNLSSQTSSNVLSVHDLTHNVAGAGSSVVIGTSTLGGISLSGSLLHQSASVVSDFLSVTSSTVSGGILSTANVTGSTSFGDTLIRLTNTRVGGSLEITSGVLNMNPYGGAFQLLGASSVAGHVSNNATITGQFVNMRTNSSVGSGITNTGTVSGPTSFFPLIAVYGSSVTGGITNTGLLNNATVGATTGGTGIGVYSNSTVVGSILNTGRIEAAGDGIDVAASRVTVGVTNNGTITSGATGIFITGGASVGRVLNTGTINASSGNGILVSGSSVASGINNGGTITSAGTQGYAAGEGAITIKNGATVTGGINNSGLIDRGSAGSAIQIGNSLVQDGITNTGTITSTGVGIRLGDGIIADFFGSTITGGILNAAGATISGGDGGISAERIAGANPYVAVHTLSGGMTNRGLITSNISEAVRLGGMLIDTVVNDTTGTLSGTRGVYLSYSTVTGNVINRGLIHGNTSGLVVDNTTVSGSVLNTGTIGGQYGIILSYVTITGGLTNTGTITGTSQGIKLGNGEVRANITNSGTIHGDEASFYFSQSTLAGSITNQAGGLISGGTEGGIWLYEGSTITGSINNAGTIRGLSAPGIKVTSSSSIGGITNSGLIRGDGGAGIFISDSSMITGSIVNNAPGIISGTNHGIHIQSSTVTGGITNSGLIRGDGGAGIFVSSSSMITGAIVNASGGTISGSEDGIRIYSASSVGSGITNSGLIKGDARDGIRIDGSASWPSTITGNIANLSGGRIQGAVTGVALTEGHIVGAINNAAEATISGGTTGIYVSASSTIGDGITNAGLISGGTRSLDLNNSGSAFTIVNTGTLQGAANIGINTLNLNGNSAKVIGNTTGTGDVNVNGTFTSEGTFNVGNFNVNNGGLFNMAHAITATTMNVGGGGMLSLGAGTRSLTGDYTQAASGTFRFDLTDAVTYGKLNVSGNATLASGSIVDVRLNGTPGARIDGVIVAGGTLTNNGVTVTDNSVLYNFTPSTVRNPQELDLITAVDTTGITNVAATAPNPGVTGVAGALQTMLNNGIPAGMQPVFDRLATLTPTEAGEAMSQMVPALQGAGAQAGVNALHSMNKIIQARIESNQGLSSGNAPAERYMWMRAFGSWADQDNLKGVPGFKSKTGGFVIGGDAPVTDKVRAGGAFTYAKSDIKGNSAVSASSVDVDTYELVGYGSYNIDPLTDINVQLDLGQNKAGSRRLAFGGGYAKGDFDSLALHGSVGIGRVMPLSAQTNVTPSIRLDYTHMRTGGYTESGALLAGSNLKVDASTYREFLLTADAKAAHQLDDYVKLVGNVSAGYDFINKKAQTTSTFVGGGPAFTTDGLDVSPWVYRVGAGLIRDDKQGLEYSLRYDAEGRSSGYLNQTVSARLRWAF